jgi:hypothetical protein
METLNLIELYKNHNGKSSYKWPPYLFEYDEAFKKYRNKDIFLLEIGILNGGFLEILANYFYNAKIFVGCDIEEKTRNLIYNDPRISTVCGDAGDAATADKIKGISPVFDIVIDDGSHKSSDVIKCFVRYFDMIRDGGIYIIEDLHASYWNDWEGGLYSPYSSIAFFKRLVDIINYEHWGISKTKTEPLLGILKKYNIELDANLLNYIHSIKFINSMCFIQKQSIGMNKLGAGMVAGTASLVEPVISTVPGMFSHAPSQAKNTWSVFAVPPDELAPMLQETVDHLNQDLEQTRGQLAQTQNQLEQTRNQVQTLITSTSWQATAPLRSIAPHLPIPLRCQLRRVLKAVWWVVTPWKIPARLRFLRQRKGNAE